MLGTVGTRAQTTTHPFTFSARGASLGNQQNCLLPSGARAAQMLPHAPRWETVRTEDGGLNGGQGNVWLLMCAGPRSRNHRLSRALLVCLSGQVGPRGDRVGARAEGRNWPSLQSCPLSFRVLRTYVAHGDNLVRNGVCAVSRAGVDAMDVIDAAANSVLLDDSDTHGWFLLRIVERQKSRISGERS